MGKKKDKKKQQRREMEALLAQAMWNAGNGGMAMNGMRNGGNGLFGRLASVPPGQQLLLGALLGAGAIYVLGDEKLRGKLMKSAMGLYASVLGGIEEMKEQAADIRAEMEAHGGNAD